MHRNMARVKNQSTTQFPRTTFQLSHGWQKFRPKALAQVLYSLSPTGKALRVNRPRTMFMAETSDLKDFRFVSLVEAALDDGRHFCLFQQTHCP